MSNLSVFKLTTTGEALRGLINLRIADIERQHNLLATAMMQAKEQIVELQKVADGRVAALQQRRGRLIDNSVGISAISEVEDRLVRLGDVAGSLELLRKQAVWMHDQVVPNERYELSAHDLLLFGFERSGIDVASLVAPRY
jgi:hypothetical protein